MNVCNLCKFQQLQPHHRPLEVHFLLKVRLVQQLIYGPD